MKRRLGFTLLGVLTLLLLKLISLAFGWLNLASDVAVGAGVLVLAIIALFAPVFYHYIWIKLINISFSKDETTHEN